MNIKFTIAFNLESPKLAHTIYTDWPEQSYRIWSHWLLQQIAITALPPRIVSVFAFSAHCLSPSLTVCGRRSCIISAEPMAVCQQSESSFTEIRSLEHYVAWLWWAWCSLVSHGTLSALDSARRYLHCHSKLFKAWIVWFFAVTKCSKTLVASLLCVCSGDCPRFEPIHGAREFCSIEPRHITTLFIIFSTKRDAS